MGKVRTEKVKKIARELVRRHPSKFNSDFKNNQQLVKSLTIISSARLRNRIAGYITRLLTSVEVDQTSEMEETD
ncbi:MAG: 30S ribosomal protein S17e [Candidatus Bathyarchaeota archaeon]|nr:MAG: 30S ribosomal protein S17e [Candidatus Bathyarchaeota archaeon]